VVSEGIENWVGTPKIAGADLAKNFAAHLEAVKADMVETHIGERVEKLEKTTEGFRATTKNGTAYEARAVLIASGAGRRTLEVPGAAELENKGVVYCASCDGPLFAGMDVAVVGGGNAGFETALQLLAYAKSVTLLHRHTDFKADAVTVEKALAHPAMRALPNAEPTEVVGSPFVSALKYRDKDTGEEHELAVHGVFVEAGVVPNTAFAEDLLEFDAVKRIKVNPRNQRAYLIGKNPRTDSDARPGESGETGVQGSTVIEPRGARNGADEPEGGVWAAGDATDELYHQNNIAAGDGVKALEDIYLWLKTR
jgi:alkyl hydroperoxide reductase subunit F